VCLVRVYGVLGATAVQPCRAAADAAISLGCRELVLALDRLGPLDPVTVTVLGALRRYLRARGVRLVLAGAPPELRMALRSCGVLDRYGIEPTAAVAVAHSTTDAAVRERRP
jgi:anti-anti-sigma regulatory factor